MYSRIQAGEFENKIRYPERPTQKDKNHPTWLEWRDAKRAYDQGESEAVNKFRQACAHQFGLVGHVKEEKVWRKAWDDGHANGYTEILGVYRDLAELVL